MEKNNGNYELLASVNANFIIEKKLWLYIDTRFTSAKGGIRLVGAIKNEIILIYTKKYFSKLFNIRNVTEMDKFLFLKSLYFFKDVMNEDDWYDSYSYKSHDFSYDKGVQSNDYSIKFENKTITEVMPLYKLLENNKNSENMKGLDDVNIEKNNDRFEVSKRIIYNNKIATVKEVYLQSGIRISKKIIRKE